VLRDWQAAANKKREMPPTLEYGSAALPFFRDKGANDAAYKVHASPQVLLAFHLADGSAGCVFYSALAVHSRRSNCLSGKSGLQ
jgi:hypothetical protein